MPLDIYEKRKELGLTLEYIAKQVGVSKSTVKKWESGYIKNMRRDKIEKLANALRVSPMDILLTADSSPKGLSQSISLTKDISDKYNELINLAFNRSNQDQAILIFSGDRLSLVDCNNPVFQKVLDFIKND